MAQQSKFIDLSRTYLPIDPESLPETQHDTGGEDRPENRMPVMAYEGWNFMPTGHGYRSYFGLTATVDISALPSIPDEVFIIQTDEFKNLIIALCNDGIYQKTGEFTGAWTQLFAVNPDTTALIHYEWTFCVINNVLYIYREGNATGWKMSFAGVMTTHTPDYITMSGQMGCFKAGGRLGFWDSSDAVAWSSYEDKTSFTPSITTQANVTTFTKVIGRIVTIKQCGDGFIIYATKSIIRVRQSKGSVFQWESEVLSGQSGIAYPRQVTVANPDSNQYAWTTIGLLQIDDEKSEIVATEVYDYLKESKQPVYLKILEGRYLFVEVIDSDFIYGQVTFETNTIITPASENLTYTQNREIIDGTTEPTDAEVTQFFRFAQTPLTGINVGLQGLSFIAGDVNAPVNNSTYPTYNYEGVAKGVIGSITGLAVGGGHPGIPLALNYSAGAFSNDPVSGVTITDAAGTAIDFLPTEADLSAVWHTLLDYTDDATLAADINLAVLETADPNPSKKGEYNFVAFDIEQLFFTAASLWNKEIVWCNAAMNEWRRFIEDPANVIQQASLTTAVNPWAVTYNHITGVATVTGNALPYAVSNYSAYYYVPTDLSAEQYALISAALVMYKSITRARRWALKLSTDWQNFQIASYKRVSTGVDYASIAAILAVLDAATPANAPHVLVVPTVDTTQHRLNTAGGAQADTVTVNFTYDVIRRYQFIDKGIITVPDCNMIVAAAQLPVEGLKFNSATQTYSVDAGYTPPTFANLAVGTSCDIGDDRKTRFGGYYVRSPINPASSSMNNEVIQPTLGGVAFDYVAIEEAIFPETSATFLLQDGSPAPINPTMNGAYVYDIQYKRWGKMKGQYKVLLDFAPINVESSPIVPYTKFGVSGALIGLDYLIKLFDANPTDSYIKYGKIGLFRLGVTTLEELIAQFRLQSTGTLETETSLDGKTVESSLNQSTSFTNTRNATHKKSVTGKWHNVKITGQFDLTYLEFISRRSGRR